MSRISTSWRRCWQIAQATLCATVEPPAPPLAEMKPTVRPMGAAPSAAKSSVMAATIGLRGGRQHDVFGDAGADQLAIEHTSLTWPRTISRVVASQTSASRSSAAGISSGGSVVSTMIRLGVGLDL